MMVFQLLLKQTNSTVQHWRIILKINLKQSMSYQQEIVLCIGAPCEMDKTDQNPGNPKTDLGLARFSHVTTEQ